MELFPLVFLLFFCFVFLRENYVRSWALPAFVAFSLRAQRQNEQPAVTYDTLKRGMRSITKGPDEAFCLPYLSQMVIR